jgi:hypothetical protein
MLRLISFQSFGFFTSHDSGRKKRDSKKNLFHGVSAEQPDKHHRQQQAADESRSKMNSRIADLEKMEKKNTDAGASNDMDAEDLSGSHAVHGNQNLA